MAPPQSDRRSTRLQYFDYAGNATYVLTICTRGRLRLFGTIENGLMHLNEIGVMVERKWVKSATIRAELDLHSLVTMPNHLHALATITPTEGVPDAGQTVETAPGQRRPLERPAARSLGSFVNGFKAATTRQYRDLSGLPGVTLWQRGYCEHIVRNERDFNRINEYMITNPMNWETDREHAAGGRPSTTR